MIHEPKFQRSLEVAQSRLNIVPPSTPQTVGVRTVGDSLAVLHILLKDKKHLLGISNTFI